MKKIIAVIGVFLLVSAFSMTAFANENDRNEGKDKGHDTDRKVTSQTRQHKDVVQVRDHKIIVKDTEKSHKVVRHVKKVLTAAEQAKKAAFRKALNEKRVQMLANKAIYNALNKQNKQLRRDIAKSIQVIKKSDKTLSATTLAKIEASRVQIKAIKTVLKTTKKDMKKVFKDSKGFMKTKDIASMNTAFEKIFAIQLLRNTELQKINVILQELAAQIATDTTPVATPVPTPVATPEPTPVPTPVATPVPTPVATPVATPDTTASATPAA